MGGAAVLLSNRPSDRRRSKYQLMRTVRTHTDRRPRQQPLLRVAKGGRRVGIALSKDLMAMANDALKTNITTLGPLVLPMSEQLLFFLTIVTRKVFKMKKVKNYSLYNI
nr:3-ketoacyl-CoA synthase 20-like [Ipomoea batatas]